MVAASINWTPPDRQRQRRLGEQLFVGIRSVVSPHGRARSQPAAVTSAAVTSSRTCSPVATAVCAASLAVMLAACGSNADMTSASAVNKESSSVAAPASTCPSAMPQSGGTPEWTLRGATGSVSVTGPTAATAPLVEVDAPFSVTQTQVHTLQAGDGPVVTPPAGPTWVSLCLLYVNGRTGSVNWHESSWNEGALDPTAQGVIRQGVIQWPLTIELPLGKVIVGQRVGSTVAVAYAPAAGATDGPQWRNTDTIIYVITILGVTHCIPWESTGPDDPNCG